MKYKREAYVFNALEVDRARHWTRMAACLEWRLNPFNEYVDEEARERIIEDRLRTYLLAGCTPHEIEYLYLEKRRAAELQAESRIQKKRVRV